MYINTKLFQACMMFQMTTYVQLRS